MNKKPNSNKKISIFYFLIMLIVTSIIVVIYINNIVEVNRLAVENNSLREEIKNNMQVNDQLRTEAEKLSSFERIKSIAAERYDLSYRENSLDENNTIILSKSKLK